MTDERLLARLFVDAAARRPAAPAVTQGGTTLSYATLAAAVAERAQSVGDDGRSIVALDLDNTPASVIDLVAALAGADVLGCTVARCRRAL